MRPRYPLNIGRRNVGHSAWRVLVVDDHAGHRELARALFQALGCDVTLATHGEEAVQIATGAPFDLIVMDRTMPGCGGDEATRLIRHEESRSRRALIVSHSTEPPLTASIYDRVASKPISTSEIIGLIEDCTRKFRSPTSRPR